MDTNKRTTFLFIAIAVVLVIGIAFVMTRTPKLEAEKAAPVAEKTDAVAPEPEQTTAEAAPDKDAEKAADKPAEPVAEKAPEAKAPAAEKEPFNQQAADEIQKLEKSLGIKGKDALARTLNYSSVAGKQMTTIIFIAQEKTYKLDVANPMLYSCKLAFPATYFKIKRAVLGTKDVLNGVDVGEIYVYGTDTTIAPTACKLN